MINHIGKKREITCRDFLFEVLFLLEITVFLIKAMEPLGQGARAERRPGFSQAGEEDTHFTVCGLCGPEQEAAGMKRACAHWPEKEQLSLTVKPPLPS